MAYSIHSIKFIFLSGIILVCNLLNSCINQVDPSGTSGATVASCSECHTFPGSEACRVSTVTIDGIPRTTCNECHADAIVLDSSLTDTNYAFYDKVVTVEDEVMPATDMGHADGKVTLDYNQCVRCHSYPPYTEQDVQDTLGHFLHVGLEWQTCHECHYASVNSILIVDTINNYQYYRQVLDTLPGGQEVASLNHAKHRNHMTDIVFGRKAELAGASGSDTLYIWDPVERSCVNVSCHGEPGDVLYQKAFWTISGNR